MNEFWLIYPMFALVLLTASVLVILFRGRVRALRAGNVTAGYFKIYQGAIEPEATAQAARHFSNLFEAPTLFYAACLAAMVTHSVSVLVVVFAWLYVAARLAHALIHLGRNKLRPRVAAYFLSWVALLVLWGSVAFSVMLRGSN